MPTSGIELLFEGRNFSRLMLGLWVSVRIALLSMLFSIVLGTGLGLVMNGRSRVGRALSRVYLEFIRIMPPLVLLFLVYFDLTKVAGINLSGEVAAVVVFTLWGTAEMGDLVRGSISSIPAHQYDSARALGMTELELQRHVVLPQAVRRLVPLTVNLTTRMIKTTSLVALIGVVEILKVAQQIIDANRFEYPGAALWIYGAVFFIYFIVCFVISAFSRRLERKWALS
ncbi:amino acid ABC transporter permease [Nigerium massiliense]|uniref:amino acid ABC transporter permease n=1 Tax=Nigerium massiliense TaxID=1522317 RepID=UPI00058C64AC|nr:amino acid ABC transporter permease [Nigerium massiliense]